jgi:hypothetical protein
MSDKFNTWLEYVDKQLCEEAFDYLKLGLHSKLRRHFTELEGIEKPSHLYRFLLDHRGDKSETEVLQMFLHALEMLGSKLRGDFVLRKGFGEGSVYKLSHPGRLDVIPKDFSFYLCLLGILTEIVKDSKLHRQIKTKFTKESFLDTNHRNIKNLADLFIELCQKNFLTPDYTRNLQLALVRYEAWECLAILKEYHQSVGMALVPQAERAMQAQGYSGELWYFTFFVMLA